VLQAQAQGQYLQFIYSLQAQTQGQYSQFTKALQAQAEGQHSLILFTQYRKHNSRHLKVKLVYCRTFSRQYVVFMPC